MFNSKMIKTMTAIQKNSGYAPLIRNFFDDFLTRDLFDTDWLSNSETGTTIPKVNIHESERDFTVEVAAPGMNKDDFEVTIDNNLLTITSELRKEEKNITETKYTRKEFSYQSFQRTFTLPDTVDANKIAAKYNNGILELLLPKREEAMKKPVKTIKIS
jgi:HSP20 family protein